MKILKIALAIITIILSSNAYAALYERLGGAAYYDDVADLTWLSDANVGGRLRNWNQANNWALNLNINGIDDWRLPNTLQPDPSCSTIRNGLSQGRNCTGSELGNMFYNVLGGTSGTAISASHNANYDLFTNIQDFFYWSATQPDSGYAWVFHFDSGSQEALPTVDIIAGSTWAVRSGDISPVPLPAAVWLFASGLISLICLRRRNF